MKSQAPYSPSELLDLAFLNLYTIEKLTLSQPEMSLAQAYQIQAELVGKRVGRGEKIVGFKMGLTSYSKMRQMQVDCPIAGTLTQPMKCAHQESLPLENFIHPRVEPEVAFILGKEITGPITLAEAQDACSGICCALEVIDSRYHHFKFQLPDVVADNCSASAFIIGEVFKSPKEINPQNLGVILEVAGRGCQFASTNAVLGNPYQSLVELSKMISLMDHPSLPQGSIILTGGITEAVPLLPGFEVQVSIQGLGKVSLLPLGEPRSKIT